MASGERTQQEGVQREGCVVEWPLTPDMLRGESVRVAGDERQNEGGGLARLRWVRQFTNVLRLFRPFVFHCTSRENLKGILSDGEIKPNAGERPFTWGQAFYARERGLVCVFDFADATPMRCMRHAQDAWWPVFTKHQPVTISILLDRSMLDIIPNQEAFREVGWHGTKGLSLEQIYEGRAAKFIPRVEAWSRGPIPREAFRAYVVTCGVDPTAHVLVPESADPFPAIDDVIADFKATHAEAYAWRERIKMYGAFGLLTDEELIELFGDRPASDE